MSKLLEGGRALPATGLGASLALALLLTLTGVEAPRPGPPQPSDPAAEDDDHESQAERLRWLEQLHRSAPGVDWRAIEGQNREAERLRRNALATGMLTPPPTGWTWEEVGSRNQAGHTRCAAYGPERPGGRRLYVGSANGGLWEADLDGGGWTPLSDELFGGVDEVVALAPPDLADPDILLMLQGSNLRRSDDGGLTWTQPTGSNMTSARALAVLPGPSPTVLLFGRSGSNTVLRASTDLGQTFQTRATWPSVWLGDLWVPQVGPNAGQDLFAYQGGVLHTSHDGGFTWSAGSSPATGSEGHLAGSEAGGGTVLYPVTRVGNSWVLHRSDDLGASYSGPRSLPEYWGSQHSLCAFSSDPDRLVTGGVNGFRSADGGQSWTQINSWGEYYSSPATKLHADLRGIDVHPHPSGPAFGDIVYFNTDGGTYRSTDFGATVQNLCLVGLGVGQFYSTRTDATDANRIHGGTQDQGYQTGNKVPSSGAGPSTSFVQIISGDYGHLSTHASGSLNRVYAPYPGFTLVVSGGQSLTQQASFPQGSSHLWLPPVVADPQAYGSFFFCGRYLWRQSSPNWMASQHSTTDFGAGAGSYLSALAFSPVNPDLAWAANDAGRLWRSQDAGVTWTESPQGIPGSHYFYGNCLAPHPTDPLKVAASGSGYSTAGVRLSTDGGVTWTALASGLPATLVYDVEWSIDQPDDLFAATEAGAYHFDAATQTWSNAMGSAAPATTYWSVERVPHGNLMRFGTYGRGIWDLVLGGEPDEVTRYCSPNMQNSTGLPGRLDLTGTVDASSTDLTLTASQLPPGQFGMFLCSRTPASIPFPGGAFGVLCLGAPIGRFQSSIQNSGPAGVLTHTVDLSAMPMQPMVAVQPGDTWCFQAWYREVLPIQGSNFTDALSVQFP